MNVKTTKQFVKEKNIAAEFIEHAGLDGLTSEGAARATSASIAQIIKVLCFVDRERKCFVILQGDRKVDSRKIPSFKKPRMATAKELSDWFKAEPGGIPPVGLPEDAPKIVDSNVLAQPFVIGSAGSRFVALKIRPDDIAKQPNTTVLNIAQS